MACPLPVLCILRYYQAEEGSAFYFVSYFFPPPSQRNEEWAAMAKLGALLISSCLKANFQWEMVLFTGT